MTTNSSGGSLHVCAECSHPKLGCKAVADDGGELVWVCKDCYPDSPLNPNKSLNSSVKVGDSRGKR